MQTADQVQNADWRLQTKYKMQTEKKNFFCQKRGNFLFYNLSIVTQLPYKLSSPTNIPTWKNCRAFDQLEPLNVIYLLFAQGWMATNVWKWDKMDKFRRLSVSAGHRKVLAVSLL